MARRWEIEKHRESLQTQDLGVMIKVKELEYNGSDDVVSLIADFKKKISTIPQTNTYSADMLYSMEEISSNKVEVWKMTPRGDKKFLMFTLTLTSEKFNPFNF